MVKKKDANIEQADTHTSDEDLRVLIGKRIARIRTRCGYSGKRAAIESGINRSVLSQIEHGKAHISAVSLYKLAYVLRCNVAEFFPALSGTTSLTEADIALMAQESAQAADFLKKAFKK